MAILRILLLSLLMLGCNEATQPDISTTLPVEAAMEAVASKSPATDSQDASRPEPDFVELGAETLGSPFTKETVLKLNAIVQRSLDTIREYDDSIGEIRNVIANGTEEEARQAMKTLIDLSERAHSAQIDIRDAEAELIASGEYYSDEILAGMITFVEKVDVELKEEIKDLESVPAKK